MLLQPLDLLLLRQSGRQLAPYESDTLRSARRRRSARGALHHARLLLLRQRRRPLQRQLPPLLQLRNEHGALLGIHLLELSVRLRVQVDQLTAAARPRHPWANGSRLSDLLSLLQVLLLLPGDILALHYLLATGRYDLLASAVCDDLLNATPCGQLRTSLRRLRQLRQHLLCLTYGLTNYLLAGL